MRSGRLFILLFIVFLSGCSTQTKNQNVYKKSPQELALERNKFLESQGRLVFFDAPTSIDLPVDANDKERTLHRFLWQHYMHIGQSPNHVLNIDIKKSENEMFDIIRLHSDHMTVPRSLSSPILSNSDAYYSARRNFHYAHDLKGSQGSCLSRDNRAQRCSWRGVNQANVTYGAYLNVVIGSETIRKPLSSIYPSSGRSPNFINNQATRSENKKDFGRVSLWLESILFDRTLILPTGTIDPKKDISAYLSIDYHKETSSFYLELKG